MTPLIFLSRAWSKISKIGSSKSLNWSKKSYLKIKIFINVYTARDYKLLRLSKIVPFLGVDQQSPNSPIINCFGWFLVHIIISAFGIQKIISFSNRIHFNSYRLWCSIMAKTILIKLIFGANNIFNSLSPEKWMVLTSDDI